MNLPCDWTFNLSTFWISFLVFQKSYGVIFEANSLPCQSSIRFSLTDNHCVKYLTFHIWLSCSYRNFYPISNLCILLSLLFCLSVFDADYSYYSCSAIVCG